MGGSDTNRGRRGRFSPAHGQTSRPVMVLATAEGLDVRDEMGLLVATWKTVDLRADGRIKGGGAVRLRCTAEPGARLEVEDSVFLRDKALGLAGQRQPHLKLQILVALALVLVGVAAAVMWRPMSGQRGMVSPNALAALPHDLRPCLGPAGQEALSRLGARLAAGLPPESRPGRVVVVESASPAIARLEDGTLAIPVAVVAQAASPDTLAAALAEAMAPGTRSLLGQAGIGANRPPALRDSEWQALKGICR